MSFFYVLVSLTFSQYVLCSTLHILNIESYQLDVTHIPVCDLFFIFFILFFDEEKFLIFM